MNVAIHETPENSVISRKKIVYLFSKITPKISEFLLIPASPPPSCKNSHK